MTLIQEFCDICISSTFKYYTNYPSLCSMIEQDKLDKMYKCFQHPPFMISFVCSYNVSLRSWYNGHSFSTLCIRHNSHSLCSTGRLLKQPVSIFMGSIPNLISASNDLCWRLIFDNTYGSGLKMSLIWTYVCKLGSLCISLLLCSCMRSFDLIFTLSISMLSISVKLYQQMFDILAPTLLIHIVPVKYLFSQSRVFHIN